jgi:hypothetical protein
MSHDFKLIVAIGADPTIKLHRYCKRNWQNYFDYIDFDDYFFHSRSLTEDSDFVSPNEIVFSLPEELRNALALSIGNDGVYHSDWTGEFGRSVILSHKKLWRLLLNRVSTDFVLYCPTATSVIDIEQIKSYLQLHYDKPGYFYGGAPVPIVHQPSAEKFWFISGSGVFMSRATLELLLARLNDGVPNMNDDLLFALFLGELPRQIICRRSLAVKRSIYEEYDTMTEYVKNLRKEGYFCFRINSSRSKELIGGRDSNDSMLHSLVFNVVMRARQQPVKYISHEFIHSCTQIGVKVDGPALQPGQLYRDHSTVVSGF